MKKFLVSLFLVTAAAIHAQTFNTATTLQPGYSVTTAVSASGALSLSAGTYTAASWRIDGPLRLLTGGSYVIVGKATITGRIFADGGPVLLHFTDGVTTTGTIDAAVTITQGGAVITDPPIVPTIPLPAGTASAAPLVNISTRISLVAGQVLNPGFVVGGTASRRVLVRAVGPGLAAFGVAGTATAPTLALFSGQTQIAANAGWGGGAGLSAVFAGVGAFALAPTSADAAVLLTLAPGNYTARVTGVGELLLEIYFVD